MKKSEGVVPVDGKKSSDVKGSKKKKSKDGAKKKGKDGSKKKKKKGGFMKWFACCFGGGKKGGDDENDMPHNEDDMVDTAVEKKATAEKKSAPEKVEMAADRKMDRGQGVDLGKPKPGMPGYQSGATNTGQAAGFAIPKGYTRFKNISGDK